MGVDTEGLGPVTEVLRSPHPQRRPPLDERHIGENDGCLAKPRHHLSPSPPPITVAIATTHHHFHRIPRPLKGWAYQPER